MKDLPLLSSQRSTGFLQVLNLNVGRRGPARGSRNRERKARDACGLGCQSLISIHSAEAGSQARARRRVGWVEGRQRGPTADLGRNCHPLPSVLYSARGNHGMVEILSDERRIRLAGERVALELAQSDERPDRPGSPHGLAQRLLVADGQGGWQSVGSGGTKADLCLRANGFDYRLLFDQASVIQSEGAEATLQAQVERDAFRLHTVWSVRERGSTVHVRTDLVARTRLDLTALWHTYAFAEPEPEWVWLPNLKGASDRVVGDHTFRSPCAVLQQGSTLLALVPDLDAYGESRIRTALDYDPAEPAVAFGLINYRPVGHVYYQPVRDKPLRLGAGERVSLAFWLLADLKAKPRQGFRQVVRMLWAEYGVHNLCGLEPQTLAWDGFARYAADNLLHRYRVWQTFRLGELEVGGSAVRIVRPHLNQSADPLPEDTTPRVVRNYLTTPTLRWRDKWALLRASRQGVHPHIFNQVWFNNLRTAFGLGYFGRRWGDDSLQVCARQAWTLALSAPVVGGVWPSVCVPRGDEPPGWIPGTRGWRYTPHYHLPDACTTGVWMLTTHAHLDRDQAWVERARGLGDLLVQAQLPSGAVPAWVEIGSDGAPRAVAPLVESASAGAAGMFLAALAAATGDERYLEAARRVAEFLLDQVWPAAAWDDFETFFSCSRKPLGWVDPATGLRPQNSMSLYWAASTLRRLADLTRVERYAEAALACLDLLLLYQQVWDAPFLDICTVGGFGVMNTDAEWNDARQAPIALLLLDTYAATGCAEYMFRGVAALRAAFTLMYTPENAAVAPGNLVGVAETDWGATAENYGHAGTNTRIPGYVMPDWGSGTAVAAAAWAQLRYGDLYVDVARGHVFGLNGCRVVQARIEPGLINLDLECLPPGRPSHLTPLDRRYMDTLRVKASHVDTPWTDLVLNGRPFGTHTARALRTGVDVELPSRVD